MDWRGGAAKSLFSKRLHVKLDKRKIKYISLAPTNIAARLDHGLIIKNFASFNMKSFLERTFTYDTQNIDEF